MGWLRVKLGMGVGNNAFSPSSGTMVSKHRLVCAALIRALAWPTSTDSRGMTNSSSVNVVDNQRELEHEDDSPWKNIEYIDLFLPRGI